MPDTTTIKAPWSILVTVDVDLTNEDRDALFAAVCLAIQPIERRLGIEIDVAGQPLADLHTQADFDAAEAARVDPVLQAKALLREHGYVVLKEKSYRQAQERQRVAEALRQYAIEDRECTRRWAQDCLTEERRLRERLTFVWGIAQAHGATVEELSPR